MKLPNINTVLLAYTCTFGPALIAAAAVPSVVLAQTTDRSESFNVVSTTKQQHGILNAKASAAMNINQRSRSAASFSDEPRHDIHLRYAEGVGRPSPLPHLSQLPLITEEHSGVQGKRRRRRNDANVDSWPTLRHPFPKTSKSFQQPRPGKSSAPSPPSAPSLPSAPSPPAIPSSPSEKETATGATFNVENKGTGLKADNQGQLIVCILCSVTGTGEKPKDDQGQKGKSGGSSDQSHSGQEIIVKDGGKPELKDGTSAKRTDGKADGSSWPTSWWPL